MTDQERLMEELKRLNPNAPMPAGIIVQCLDKLVFNHLSHIDISLKTVFWVLGIQSALVLATFGAVIGIMILK